MLAALSASATSFAPARAGTMKMTVDLPASDVPSTPAPLVTEDMMRKIGDYGFDPLGLGKGDTFVPFREAEIKHGRLAMLAAVAWPLQEILHPIFVDLARSSGFGGSKDILIATGGKSPSLLNGGLDQWEIAPTLALAVFMASVLERKNVVARAEAGLAFNEYSKTELPGDLKFDPLRITRSLSREEKVEFLEKELLNGRLAMIAVTCYVLEEALFGVPVVRYTPELFQPLIFANDFRAFMDAQFSSASMMGSVDGVAI
jgi:hypothetical protein